MPSYVPPTQGVQPDFPGNAEGLEPGYTNFPRQLFKSVKQTPARGGDTTSILFAGNPANPVENNVAWQQLNAALGTNLKINQVLQADYAARWGAVTAGNDLPDLMFISIVPTLPNVPAFLKQSCADLTPYLSGDAIKNYPNLANIAATPWKVTVQNGGIYGVPLPRTRSGWPMFVNQSRLDEIGAPPPKNADDFTQLCKALTSARDNRWAMGVTDDNTSGPYNMLFFQGMFRAPNNWRVDQSGKWIKDIETDEYRAALEYNRGLIEAGLRLARRQAESGPEQRPDGWHEDHHAWQFLEWLHAVGQYRADYQVAHHSAVGARRRQSRQYARPRAISATPRSRKILPNASRNCCESSTSSPPRSAARNTSWCGMVRGTWTTSSTPTACRYRPTRAKSTSPFPGCISVRRRRCRFRRSNRISPAGPTRRKRRCSPPAWPIPQSGCTQRQTRRGRVAQPAHFRPGAGHGRRPGAVERPGSLVKDWRAQGGDRVRDEFQKAADAAQA